MRQRASFALRSGFTLLEILVVVAILAIVAGLVVASIDGDERGTLDREARRFAGAVSYAARRAELRHETLGVSGEDAAWRFWLRSEGRWRALSDDEPLAARSLPASFGVAAISFAGQPVAPQTIVPLHASGRNEPYVFRVFSPTLEAIVAADPMNRVHVTGPRPVTQ